MLFDLRGSGRRTTVKVVYVTLAILMGGGLVFFGIGGDVNGGLFDAISGSSSGQSSDEDTFVKKANARSARPRPTRRTRPPGPRWSAPATSSRARATTWTRTRASTPPRAVAQLKLADRPGRNTSP